ncbi:MAG: tRNA (N(6)-L-threonylcarbamoyladenosine(37)-C(2))-methylthiotransferase MtaB [Solobacterium sp.]|nr:tRNA (N(6)-L-threonylcarbamoyladenosine(37)-C(2))-methylthiotransferase MtaB [Solobacterium sp.]
MKFAVKNLGCKVNDYETESVASMMEQQGYERTGFDESTDIALIFTCAVTNTAAAKSRQMINRARKKNPDAVIVVAGCYAQIDPEALKTADILVGSAHKKQIPEYVGKYLAERSRIRDVHPIGVTPFEELRMERFPEQTRAYLKIQDGCNQFCTYCVIPYARGRERSMDPDLAVSETKAIAANHHEIVLTGIHTGRYGREYGITLAGLMERMLDSTKDLERLRISSIEVTELDDHFLELLHSSSRIARHLHIPLQSGSDSVLKRMGRPYTTDEFYEKIEQIRKNDPDISISTDLIVGFPGESEEEFEETYSFLKKCRFSFLHVFPYSMRDGTAAAAMKGQISPRVKKKRAAACAALSAELYDSYKSGWIGRTCEVMIETSENGYSFGHSSEYLPVRIAGECEKGVIEEVMITKLEDHQLFAERRRNYAVK